MANHDELAPRGSSQTLVTKAIVISSILAPVILFSFYVWPTAYRFDSFDGLPVRIHRFTGNAEILTANGWKDRASKRDANPTPKDTPTSQEAAGAGFLLGAFLVAMAYQGLKSENYQESPLFSSFLFAVMITGVTLLLNGILRLFSG